MDIENIKKSAYEHFLVNGETYIVKTIDGLYYCDQKNLKTLHNRDHEAKKQPKVIGCWHENHLLNGAKLSPSYSEYGVIKD